MNISFGLIVVLCIFTYVNCKTFPECNGKPSQTYVASYDDCRSFIYCDGENSFEDTCSLGLAFNPEDLSCDSRENVYCDDYDEEDEDDIEMNNSASATMPSSIIVPASTKKHPTPPGRPLSKTPTNSPMRSTPKGNSNSRRPVPTRKPSLGSSSTLRPKPSTPKPTTKRILSTTRKNTPTISVSPNRPSPPAPVTRRTSGRPKTTISTRRPTITSSSPIGTESPIQFIPTPPGGKNNPSQSKAPVLTTLPKETEPTEKSTSYVSSTKSHPKTKAPLSSSSSSSLPTTKKYQTELPTSSSTAATIEITLASIEEECTKKKAGSFKDPDNCHYYYRCVRGVLNKQECPMGFGWNAKSKMCTSKGCSRK